VLARVSGYTPVLKSTDSRAVTVFPPAPIVCCPDLRSAAFRPSHHARRPRPSLPPRPTPAAGCVPSYLRHASSLWPALTVPVAPPVTPLGRSRPTLPQQATRRRRVATPSCVQLASRPAPLPHPPTELTPALHLSVSLRGDCLHSPRLPPTANRHDCRLRPAQSPRGTTRQAQRLASAPSAPPQRVRTAPGFLRLLRPADAETHPAARLRFSDVQHGSAFSTRCSAVQDRVVPTPSRTPLRRTAVRTHKRHPSDPGGHRH